MTRNLREHIEVEIALLAGVLGFFLGGLINFRKEVIDIVLSAVVTGVLVFFTSYFAMKLVFHGTKPEDSGEAGAFGPDNFEKAAGAKRTPAKPSEAAATKAVKGKKLDLISRDDSLFDDLYKK